MKLKSYSLASLVVLLSLVFSSVSSANEWTIDKGINLTYHWYNPDNEEYNDFHPFVGLQHESGFNVMLFIDSYEELNSSIGYRKTFASNSDLWYSIDAALGYSKKQTGIDSPFIPVARLGYKNVWISPGLIGYDIKW